MHRDLRELRELPPRDTRHPAATDRPPSHGDPDSVDLALQRVSAGAGVDVSHLAPWIGQGPDAFAFAVAFTAALVAVEYATDGLRWRHEGLVGNLDSWSLGEVWSPSPDDPTPRSWPVVARSASYALPWGDVAQLRVGSATHEIARRLAEAARASAVELLREIDQILVCGSSTAAPRARVPGIADLLDAHRYSAATAELVLRDAGRLLSESPAARVRWGRARAVVAGAPEVLAPVLSREPGGARGPVLEVVVVWRLAGVVLDPSVGADRG